jgi:hypothetical protein
MFTFFSEMSLNTRSHAHTQSHKPPQQDPRGPMGLTKTPKLINKPPVVHMNCPWIICCCSRGRAQLVLREQDDGVEQAPARRE